MRILFVAPMNSVHSARWLGHFARAGHDVHVLDSAFEGSRVDAPGVTVHQAPLTGGRIPLVKYVTRFPRWIADLRALTKRVAPDVIHIHWIGLHALGVAMTGFHPMIVTPWGSDLLVIPKGSVKRRYILGRVLAAADCFVCDAEHVKRALIERGLAEESIRLIYFGTDVDKFHPDRLDRGLAGELGFPPESPLVISMRSLESIYDVATFIKSIPLVADRCPEARFIVVGDGPERSQLETLSKSLRVESLVRFVGRLSDVDMVRYAASASAYVSTALSDAGLSASTAEAMACATPPIITDFGDNGAWVENGVTGHLFPCGDATALSGSLIPLLSDADAAARIGAAARQTIVDRNNNRTEMEKMEAVYAAVAGSPS